MISVIVPNLNEERNLPRFLNSLLAQTFKDFELIIVDGLSEDRSLDIIRSYSDKLDLKLVSCGTRNFGFVRNVGQRFARGEITFQSNSDCYFHPDFLERLNAYYESHTDTISLTGRVFPMGTSLVAYFAYPAFDLLRWFFVKFMHKYRPSGSFISYRSWIWEKVGGFPLVTVNEDGLLGQRIDALGLKADSQLSLSVGHHVKKFEQIGGLKALLFYLLR